MKINKGFTLIELVISMLVVAVAMLGFAALMAYSSRSIHSGYTKSAGTNAIQGVMRVLQSNREMLKDINFGTGNVVTLTLKDSDISNLLDGVAKEMVMEAFTRAANIPGVSLGDDNANCSLLEIQITKNHIPTQEGVNDKLVTFQVEAHFLYKPLATQSKNNEGDIDCVLAGEDASMNDFCPFGNNATTEQTDKDKSKDPVEARIENGLVCDILRTTL